MFDIGWTEMLLIGVLAIIVVGPEDLPKVMRQVSGWLNQARGMAHQFRASVDELVREADVADEQRKLREIAAENTRLLTRPVGHESETPMPPPALIDEPPADVASMPAAVPAEPKALGERPDLAEPASAPADAARHTPQTGPAA